MHLHISPQLELVFAFRLLRAALMPEGLEG
jgi:hypothetical protein